MGRLLGGWARKRFNRKLTSGRWEPARPSSSLKLPLQLVTFAGKGSFPEVAAMLESFFLHVGEPKSCRIISDGTLTSADTNILAKIHSEISVLTLDQFLTQPLPPSLDKRLNAHPLMKKLGAVIECARLKNGFYVDSDVLFFSEARAFNWNNLLAGPVPRYMQDVAITLDSRLIRDSEKPGHGNANSGLILFPRPLELSPYLERLDELRDQTPNHFSEQTIVHLALSDSDAALLDPETFILAFDDQFWFRDKYAFRGKAVCRHYTTPIRHKFWIQTLFH